jgi:hypothetical protein
MDHTEAFHDDLKLDAAQWASLEFLGIQHLPEWADEPAEDVEMRMCTCGTTLGKEATAVTVEIQGTGVVVAVGGRRLALTLREAVQLAHLLDRRGGLVAA